ncbi:hypothetical protein [Melaminivora sp.]|uniref:hypothetical protein n=1 Tax=Melaminivora sp. TaxID=1933032 RepID=UPI0028B1BFE3|nr:hypothetical protein [Melaminivora sp.]
MAKALYTYAATALVTAALASAGAWRVQEWRWQANTAAATKERQAAEDEARELRESDARQQRQLAARKVGEHAAALAGLNNQLGDARARIAKLSDRRCLDAGTVGMLNAIGKPASPNLGLRAPAGRAAGSAAAAAGPADDAGGYASERDAAEHIATCRARYAELSGQLNQILDIEDARDARRAAP